MHAKTFVTLREESCERLFNIMSTKGVVLIKAPPCTGKTSQLQLMKLWLSDQPSDQPLEVIHISFLLLDDQDDVVDFIKSRAKPTSWDDIKAGAETDRPSTQRQAASQRQRQLACWYGCCELVKGFCWEAAHRVMHDGHAMRAAN